MILSKEKILPYLKNKYVIISLAFALWVCFFDQNNLFFHYELGEQKEELETKKEHYQKSIDNSKSLLRNLSDSVYVEKYAREMFRMKKKNEDLFVIIEK